MKQQKSLNKTSVQYLKGVGPARAKLFENLGVSSIEDLFYLFPRRYEDRRNLTPIAQVEVGGVHTVSGTIGPVKSRRSYYTKKHLSEIVIDDGSGKLVCVWFNQPYLENYFKEGKRVVCFGKIDMYKNRLQMVSPEYEIIEDEGGDSLSMKRIVPVYPLTRGMSQRYLRKIMYGALEAHKDQLVDELPVSIRNAHRLANVKRSILNMHFPESNELQEEATRRISFEEFFFFQASLMLRRQNIAEKIGVSHIVPDTRYDEVIQSFPFTLTGAQKKAIDEIRGDMTDRKPMLRLLQGDVGSGKTVVAFTGCLFAALDGKQAAFMAPTEILARQHYDNLLKLINTKYSEQLRVELLTSGLDAGERKRIKGDIEDGAVDIVIGTHALISDAVKFDELSFVVVDEQHKFGVRQRNLLGKKGNNPDVLIMTATPIPRTLCITLFGDLDLSIIDEMPPGRGKISTRFIDEDDPAEGYDFVREQLKAGQQAYIVFPIISESENVDLKAAEDMFRNFKKNEFKDFRIGIAHGQLKRDKLQKTMNDFKSGKLDILVATTVLEVGVDVPNANVMVIEHAQRFGLAQLHQLRGRIGRGKADSYCLLVGNKNTEGAQARIDAMLETHDGFKLSEMDLEIRGPGQFFGRHQHGLNELNMPNPIQQMDMLELAREEAKKLIARNNKTDEYNGVMNVVKRRYPTYLANLQAG